MIVPCTDPNKLVLDATFICLYIITVCYFVRLEFYFSVYAEMCDGRMFMLNGLFQRVCGTVWRENVHVEWFYFSVYAELLDRQQKRMSLVLIPVDFFVPVRQFSDDDMEEDVFGRNIPPLTVLYEESSEIWVNVSIRQIRIGGPCLPDIAINNAMFDFF